MLCRIKIFHMKFEIILCNGFILLFNSLDSFFFWLSSSSNFTPSSASAYTLSPRPSSVLISYCDADPIGYLLLIFRLLLLWRCWRRCRFCCACLTVIIANLTLHLKLIFSAHRAASHPDYDCDDADQQCTNGHRTASDSGFLYNYNARWSGYVWDDGKNNVRNWKFCIVQSRNGKKNCHITAGVRYLQRFI